MPTARRPIQVTGPGTLMRIAIGACIVIIMASITVIAVKLGSRNESPTPAAEPTTSSTAAPTRAPTSQEPTASAKPTVGTFAGPKTTKPPAHRTAPTDPADLGVLVNKKHRLKPTSYAPKGLASVGGEKLRKDAATALRKMIADAKKDGHKLNLVSGYRSADRQEALHQTYIDRNGKENAERFSARAGESEHQTGLAADVGSGTCDLEACFGSSAAGKWVAKHAPDYGFIVRYPKGQEKVTGYDYEPWHLRFLGKDVAEDFVASKAKSLEAYYGIK